MQFWVSPVSRLSESWQPSSLDIEVAAYAMLSHFLQHQISEGIPIMRWLSRQRNSLGGFASTQVSDDHFKFLYENNCVCKTIYKIKSLSLSIYMWLLYFMTSYNYMAVKKFSNLNQRFKLLILIFSHL